MSLVVATNIPNEDDIFSAEGNIQQPFNFRNHLGSTMTIPKKAQVALQSAKINLDGSLSVNGNKVFNVYFGKEIGLPAPGGIASLNAGVSVPIRVAIEMVEENRVSPQDFAAAIQESLNRRIYHPTLRDRVSVSAKTSGTGAFDGYSMVFSQSRIGGIGTEIPIDASAVSASRTRAQSRGGAVPELFNYVGGTFSNVGGVSTASACFNVYPIQNKEGIFEVDIRRLVGAEGPNRGVCQWAIGLTRSVPGERVPNGTLAGPVYFAGAGQGSGSRDLEWLRGFADYLVYCNNSARATKQNVLQVAHAVVDNTIPGGNDVLKLKPFDYNEAGPNNLSADYDLQTNADAIEKIRFKVDGEIVTITALDGAGNNFDIVRYDATRNKGLNISPTGQARWNLLPVLYLSTRQTALKDTREIQITDYTPTGSTTLQALIDEDPHLWQNYNTRQPSLNSSWCQNLELGPEGIEPIVQLQSREPLNYGIGLGAVSPYQYDSPLAAAPNAFEYSTVVLIMGRSIAYDVNEGSLMRDLLGFGQLSVVSAGNQAVTEDYLIESVAVPNLVSNRSIFVRLDNFTQDSTNARQGQQSKIIAHLPRFDGPNLTGPLYLEPNNMIYLDLNNPDELKINSFDISLCYSDETYADALVGATIVCLHFRQDPAFRE